MQSKKFKLAALGCRTNQYEAQAYRDQLIQMGFQEAQAEEEAELCIINTCTVTASADASSRRQIRQLVRSHPRSKVVVTGCLAERSRESVEAIPGVSKVVSNLKKEMLLGELFPDEILPEFAIRQFEAHTRAFVKVQDGCNSFCTYCIIPYVRGRSRSRPLPEIVREVKSLIVSGYQEVVLTGINIGDYQDGDHSLASLVRAVDCLEGLRRLRLSSIDPDEVGEELMEAILQGKNTSHCLHLVLQSGSNVVLKRMNRKYTRQIFIDAVERLKKADPDFTFTTDVIVGFPAETENDFQETLEVMEQVCFAKVHMFPFSPRERTRAALYPNRVPEKVVKERKSRLLRAAERQAYSLRQQFLGKTESILTEEEEGEWLAGHTSHFLPVRIPKQGGLPNEFVRVRLDSNTPVGLIGSPQT